MLSYPAGARRVKWQIHWVANPSGVPEARPPGAESPEGGAGRRQEGPDGIPQAHISKACVFLSCDVVLP